MVNSIFSYYENINGKIVDITDEIPFDLPENWCWARLGTIGDWGAGATPLRTNPKYYGGDILWLKTGELNDSYVYETEEKITELALQECSLRLNKINDILIAMYGATIGKVAIVGKELTTNQACCACTTNKSVYFEYLFRYLQAIKQQLIEMGAGGAQPNISREKIVATLIPVPPYNEQVRICEKLNSVLKKVSF